MTGRIAMLTTFYPPYNFGGDGIGVQRLSRAFARRGWDVTVVHQADAYTALSGARPEIEPDPEGVKTIPLQSRFPVASNLLTHQLGRPVTHAARLKEILKPGAFDVVWFNNVSLVGGPGLLSYGDGVKIYEAHEHWLVCPTHVLWRYDRELCDARECLRCTLSYKRPPQPWRYTGYLDRQLAHVNAFIAKSRFSRDKHREFGFPRDMEVIPYFLPDLAPGAASEPAPPQARPYFLFVGRLEKIKGVQDILPAFEGPGETDLLIVGSGDYEAELRAQAGDNPRIKFTGRLHPDQLLEYYRHARALLVPSLCFETFGIILIEAFRAGAPVIARALGPFPEIVQASGGGLLYEGRAELIQAMERLQQNEAERRDLAQNARRAFETIWSEAAVMGAYERLLHGAALAKGRTDLVAALEA